MASKTVNQYRYYCTSESNFVYKWDTATPSTCPNNIAHGIDSNSITIVDTVADNQVTLPHVNLTTNSFDELRIVEKTNVIDLKSVFGKTTLRDIYSSNGTGSITNTIGTGEYNLSVSAANDIAQLSSAERGRYLAGVVSEVGVGIRNTVSALSNTQQARWGYFDESNGFYYLLNSNGLNCAILKNGVETVVTRSNFNTDVLDGTGPSGVNLNIANGIIYNIQYSWYGYGSIEFIVVTRGPDNRQRYLTCHRHFTSNAVSINNPNLPIRVELKNNTTASNANLFVAGRQYSILGKYMPNRRLNSAYVSVPTPGRTAFSPVISIRRKVDYKGVAIKLSSADFIASSDMFVEIRTKTTLTGAVFSNIPSQIATETAVEDDTTATAVTGGIVIWAGIIPADKTALRQAEGMQYDISEYDIVTVVAQSISGSVGTFNVALRWTEEW